MIENYNPYQFTEKDLRTDKLSSGVRFTLAKFYAWRDTHPGTIDEYLISCQEQLDISLSEYSRAARIQRKIFPHVHRAFEKEKTIWELEVFGVRNMAEQLNRDKLKLLYQQTLPHKKSLGTVFRQFSDLSTALEKNFSTHDDSSSLKEVAEHLKRLYRILPEKVIQNGAMGKVARTMLGVGTIAAYDLLDATPEKKRERFTQVVHGAVVYGALYAIIDDTIQDSSYISSKERQMYNEIIFQGLRTGKLVDTSRLPDNPLTEELKKLFLMFTDYYPIEKYPYLYQASESLYTAQNHDTELTMENSLHSDLRDLYPDIMIKSGMTRVVANIIARTDLGPDFYARCINSMMVHQLRDDFVDYGEDKIAARVTAFTHPNTPQTTNPLLDMFAYDAYINAVMYQNAAPILAHSQVTFLSHYLSLHPKQAHELLQKYGGDAPELLKKLIYRASQSPDSIVKELTSVDQKIKKVIAVSTARRNQADVEPRTFVRDRLQKINAIIMQYIENQQTKEPEPELVRIMKYALESGGKRLRPALTLMLAESLGVNPETISPLLLASELFQTASLLFDDLPWQDNSATRRGKPTPHTIYDAASVELTGIFMLLGGINALQELKKQYPAENILNLTRYTTQAIQQICLGQNMDLHMTKSNENNFSLEDVLAMYHLKTSVAIEASLVPLMILQKRSPEEIEHIKQYAHHAGIVFQLRDDMLDLSASSETLGKDVQQDSNKINAVRLYGLERTGELMKYHLEQAIEACQKLPFNTNLLEGITTYFATRKK